MASLHHVYVSRDVSKTAGVHAACDCGWIGQWRVSPELAREDARRHAADAEDGR